MVLLYEAKVTNPVERGLESGKMREVIQFVIVGKTSKGVFLVKMKNAFVPVERVYGVNTYSRISTEYAIYEDGA